MINYESLRELAHALAKVTGYRYIAFRKSWVGDLIVCFSDCKMLWQESKEPPFEIWLCGLERSILSIGNLPNLDWSKCQFDCKEADNGSID